MSDSMAEADEGLCAQEFERSEADSDPQLAHAEDDPCAQVNDKCADLVQSDPASRGDQDQRDIHADPPVDSAAQDQPGIHAQPQLDSAVQDQQQDVLADSQMGIDAQDQQLEVRADPQSDAAAQNVGASACRAGRRHKKVKSQQHRDDDSTDEGSDWETPVDVELTDVAPPPEQTRRRRGSWKSLKALTKFMPKSRRKYPWTQMAGHQGSFLVGSPGTILKLLVPQENENLQQLMTEPELRQHVPAYHGALEKDGVNYVQLQDLLCEFTSPCVMDVKMGVRTYLEEELEKARKKPTLRKDMYQKMVDVDRNAPTAEEHSQCAVTKPRYMQWRDEMSSSVDLGFRIEGIKKSDGASSKDFKKTKTRDSVADVLKSFFGDNEAVLSKYLQRLRDIQATQESSVFFQSHEVIGSSLLFVHDTQGNVNVWMIDFGKTEPLPKGVSVNHRSCWVEGNHEDGYLFGLDNIISILEELQASSMA